MKKALITHLTREIRDFQRTSMRNAKKRRTPPIAQRSSKPLETQGRADELVGAAERLIGEGHRAAARQLLAKALGMLEGAEAEGERGEGEGEREGEGGEGERGGEVGVGGKKRVFGLTLRLADLHARDGQRQQAISYYLRALDAYPQGAAVAGDAPPRVLLTESLARELFGDGQIQSAQRFFELAVAETSDAALQWRLRHASLACLWAAREVGAAEKLLAELKRAKTGAEPMLLHWTAGEMQATLENGAAAERHLRALAAEARREGATRVEREARLLLGEVLLSMRRPEAASKAFRAAQKMTAEKKKEEKKKEGEEEQQEEEMEARVADARAKSGLGACLAQRGRRDEARTMWREAMQELKEGTPATGATAGQKRAEADLIHRLALSWVDEGKKESGLPLWRAAIEAVESVGTLDKLLGDQVRHAKAAIGCAIHAARGGPAEGPRPAEELTAMQTVKEALCSEQMFERVFKKRLEKADTKIAFDTLWPGFANRTRNRN